MGVYNEYSQLKEVILGISEQLYLSKKLPEAISKELSWGRLYLYRFFYRIFKQKPLPDFFTKKLAAELDCFQEVLIRHGVVVRRLDPILPLSDEPEGLSQNFPRDPAMTVGDQFLFGNHRSPTRNKERRGYTRLLPYIEQAGLKITSLEMNGERYLEGGDVIVDSPFIFVGMKKRGTNQAGLDWLNSQVGSNFEIIPVEVKDPKIQHLDCCLTVIGQKLAVINRESLCEPLPSPLREYTFIDVDAKNQKAVGNECFYDRCRDRRCTETASRPS